MKNNTKLNGANTKKTQKQIVIVVVAELYYIPTMSILKLCIWLETMDCIERLIERYDDSSGKMSWLQVDAV
jgi:hypothetical protein